MNDSYSKCLRSARILNKKNVDELSDSYVIKLLKHQNINNPDKETIEVKRLVLELKRLCAEKK